MSRQRAIVFPKYQPIAPHAASRRVTFLPSSRRRDTTVHLPTFTNLIPPLTDAVLHDVTVAPWNTEFTLSVPPRDAVLHFQRAGNPLVDDFNTPSPHPRSDWTNFNIQECYNGLYNLRHGNFAVITELCALAIRVLSWAQEHPSARMGNFNDPFNGAPAGRNNRTWWIATTSTYVLLPHDFIVDGTLKNTLVSEGKQSAFDLGEGPAPAGDAMPGEYDAAPLNNAKFALFPVNLGTRNHWALLIVYKPPAFVGREKHEWKCWYLDSQDNVNGDGEDDVEEYNLRAEAATAAVEAFFRRATPTAIFVPGDGTVHLQRRVKMTPQDDGFSCALHVVANIVACVRFETIGWDRVLGWDVDPVVRVRDMTKHLNRSLHHILGLKVGDNTLDMYRLGQGATSSRSRTTARSSGTKSPTATPKRKARDGAGNSPKRRRRSGDEASEPEDGEATPSGEGDDGAETTLDEGGGETTIGLKGDGCRCARPGRKQGAESIRVRKMPSNELALQGTNRDRIVTPAGGRLADLNWHAIRGICYQRVVIYGHEPTPAHRPANPKEVAGQVPPHPITERDPESTEQTTDYINGGAELAVAGDPFPGVPYVDNRGGICG
ncbi:hypothetical protein QBC38DRAFT_491871 [Podospora fimiseda]|uniref:Ubiquitin-like protease family profile domain-containing protein n=1 Tax=Podospora fimiseda TaxID=252190 RepID=A0AAN7BD96_9PEZI|nr:hypothetical protein QBC38DRAFT_491871 [Podospora fimiseda]